MLPSASSRLSRANSRYSPVMKKNTANMTKMMAGVNSSRCSPILAGVNQSKATSPASNPVWSNEQEERLTAEMLHSWDHQIARHGPGDEMRESPRQYL